VSPLVQLAPGVGRDAVGGKAASLLRLAEAGLQVPRALVVPQDVFRAMRAAGPALPDDLAAPGALGAVEGAREAMAAASLPVEVRAALPAELAALSPGPGARFSVRSSANVEDRPGALAAGIFLSVVNVAAAGVADAARAVLASALAPGAAAYAASRGLPLADLGMAVLVHPFVAGDASGTAAWDPAAQAAPAVEVGDGGDAALRPAARAEVARAVRALAAAHGPVEVEWVATGDAVLFLQLRPYQAPRPRAWRGAAALPGGTWSWDAAHNPLPLSPAQAGLVAFVDARCRTPFRQAVVGGYLFVKSTTSEHAGAPAAGVGPAELLRALARDVDARLAGPPPALDEALATFASAYEPLYGAIQPAASAAREALRAFLAEHVAHPPPVGALLTGVVSRASERAARAAAIARAGSDARDREAAVAAYLELFGDEAPVWDVAVATYAEDPAPLHRAATAAGARAADTAGDEPEARVREALPRPLRGAFQAHLAAARAAAAVTEDDDALYARVQTAVRHALLREGRRLAAAGVLARADDVFWLPLEAVRSDARGEQRLLAPDAAAAVAEARRAHAEALADPPPGGAAPEAAGLVRGRAAAPGRAVGRVRLHPSVRAGAGAGDVVVARTLLPTELPLVAAAALVVETGGVLGHVAAQARERGIPAVTDAAGATAAFADGDLVLVDGDAGLVIRLPG
jgi:pyruvate,water dikinase